MQEIPLIQQAAEVRNEALGERSMLTNAGWMKRHGTPEGLARKKDQVATLFAAADTLDRLAEAERRGAAR